MHVSFHLTTICGYLGIFTFIENFFLKLDWELKKICENTFIKQLPVCQLVLLTFNKSTQ